MNRDQYRSAQVHWHRKQTPISASGLTADVTHFFAESILRQLPTPIRGLVIGAGLGVELDILSKLDHSEWTATDIIAERIADLRARGYRCLDLDMHDMAILAADAFDAIFSCHSLEHAHDVPRALSEFARVGRHGAVVLIAVPNTKKTKAHFTAIDDADHFRGMLPAAFTEVWWHFDQRDNTNVFVFSLDKAVPR